MSKIFGGGTKKTTEKSSSSSTSVIQRDNPIDVDIETGGGSFASLDNNGGTTKPTVNVGIDDRVRKTIAEGKSNSRDSLSRIEGVIADLRGNTNAFVNARVRPLEEALDSRIAQQERDFASRGIFGSLASDETTRTSQLGQREIADQRAFATQEVLNSVLSAEGVAGNANKELLAAASQDLQVELGELGISLDILQASQASRLPIGETSTSEGTNTSKEKNGGNILGRVFSAASAFSTT